MTYNNLGKSLRTGRPVLLPQSSKRLGTSLIGVSGMGKSTLLETMILQDIEQQRGLCL